MGRNASFDRVAVADLLARQNGLMARNVRELGEVRAVVAAAVQWRKVRVADLAGELTHGPAAGSALLRTVLIEAADGIRSAAEAAHAAVAATAMSVPGHRPLAEKCW